jgi:hypothetical protein
MKQIYILTTIIILSINQTFAQTEWTGPTITISKADFDDWTLETSQDRITPNVWLTRANSRGLFNIVLETEFDNGNYTSPLDTEWANGTIADGVGTLTFDTWDVSNGEANPTLGQNKVLHLITDDIYIDFVVTAWTQGDGSGNPPGGGFTYQRSTDQSLSTNEFELDNFVKLFPNPSSEFIHVSGLIENQKYTLYNILGAEIKNGLISNNEQIDIRNFTNGLYFLKFEDGTTMKLLKE